MKHRRFLLAVAALVIIAGSFALWHFSSEDPLGEVYHKIQIGMSMEEVDKLFNEDYCCLYEYFPVVDKINMVQLSWCVGKVDVSKPRIVLEFEGSKRLLDKKLVDPRKESLPAWFQRIISF